MTIYTYARYDTFGDTMTCYPNRPVWETAAAVKQVIQFLPSSADYAVYAIDANWEQDTLPTGKQWRRLKQTAKGQRK